MQLTSLSTRTFFASFLFGVASPLYPKNPLQKNACYKGVRTHAKMDISLRKIDKSNYEAVCDLDVTSAQEEYVACNMWSLVEAHYNIGYTCRAIYHRDKPVGFFMWVLEKPTKVSIWRFMVGKEYQQKGIGRAALALALGQITSNSQLKEIEICYNPRNPVAKEFYSTFGFQEIGLDEDSEDMLARISV